jgi:hypothetical protein
VILVSGWGYSDQLTATQFKDKATQLITELKSVDFNPAPSSKLPWLKKLFSKSENTAQKRAITLLSDPKKYDLFVKLVKTIEELTRSMKGEEIQAAFKESAFLELFSDLYVLSDPLVNRYLTSITQRLSGEVQNKLIPLV